MIFDLWIGKEYGECAAEVGGGGGEKRGRKECRM
jgi:hypothetical protein